MFAGRPARSELVFTTKESSYEDHTKSVHTNEIRRKRETTQSVSQYTIELTSGHRKTTDWLVHVVTGAMDIGVT
jgi:hypothetical protein